MLGIAYTIESTVFHLGTNAVGLLSQQLSGGAQHADTVVRLEVPIQARPTLRKCSGGEAKGDEDLRETHIGYPLSR
jgi:hypothetical protein